MDTVTVIIPAYNAEEDIENCIKTLLNQTYVNLEIIIINDGSCDQTANIVKRYLSDIVYIEQENRGVAAARNRGLEVMKGDWVLFLDPDDYLDPDCIEKTLKSAKEKNADITKFRLLYEYPNGDSFLDKPEFEDGFFILKDGFRKNIYEKMLGGTAFNSVCRTLYRREILNGIYFDTRMSTAEDAVFNIEAYTRARSFLYLSEIYYHYVQKSGGLTGAGLSVKTKYKCNFMLLTKQLESLKLWGMGSLRFKIRAVFRLFVITVSKISRIIKF